MPSLNLCPEIPPVSTPDQALKLCNALAKANPDAKWSVATERMGVNKNDDIVSPGFWFKYEKFKLNGVPVYEIGRGSHINKARITDLRSSHEQLNAIQG